MALANKLKKDKLFTENLECCKGRRVYIGEAKDLFSRMSAVVLIWILAKRMFNNKLAIISAFFAFLPLLCLFSSCWWNAQAETFMMPLSALSALLAFSSIRNRTSGLQNFFSLLTGLVLSQMLFLKPSGFWLVIGLLIFLGFFRRTRKNHHQLSPGHFPGLMRLVILFLAPRNWQRIF
jgi:4-amino-4-deoxy-L-arabinose transferase-like glycosyltransferase